MNPQTQDQTKLTNPPTGQTQMTNPPQASKVKMTKVRVMTDIWLDRTKGVVPAGSEIEMTPEELKEFCDKRFTGPFKHSGEIGKKNAVRSQIRRAIRMSEVQAIEAARKASEGVEDDAGEDEAS